MLQKLTIRNYALIDTLDIEFDKGLNIITGETGAGKSIILGALSLILGQRAESKYFFNQAKKCVIEGTFFLANDYLKNLFDDHDLDFGNEGVLRREISMDGKSRAFVNDTPVNLATLKLIGEQLIAIHSQHATQEINNPDFQLLIVDSLASHTTELATYRTGFKELKLAQSRLQALIAAANEARNKQDYEQFLYNELAQANLREDEQDVLESELERLTHAETIKRNLLNASGLLTENETSAVAILKEATIQLQHIEKFDPAVNSLNERLKSALIELKDIADETLAMEEKTVWDEGRLAIINQRLDLIYGLQQKHSVSTISDLLLIQQKLADNLNQLLSSDEEIENLTVANKALANSLREQATSLSSNRKKAIKIVEGQITTTLKQVAMPNAGQALAPVSKVASGGELSRLMLAIKALLAKHTSLPTLIFDEIDTGISGETALKVGDVIAALGKDMQVLSITHLPQIAAKGSAHYFVYKNETEQKTTTGIRKLNHDERIMAIAEMLSGKNPGASALENAKELLN
jgi:DNA repair protein RecN (Recombination protein N)